jgi:hypothetical protein
MRIRSSCPKCAVTTLHRIEYVIHAGQSYRSIECQACGHQWQTLETGEHVPGGPNEDSDPPDRSRSRTLDTKPRTPRP